MLDDIIYRNHRGEEAAFGEGGLFANESTLRDVAWEASRIGRSLRLGRSKSERSLPVRLCLPADEDGREARDRLFDLMDEDARTGEPGAFVANGYEMRCFVTQWAFSKYLLRDGYLRAELTVLPVDGVWTRTVHHEFRPSTPGPPGGLDLPCDLPCDLTPPPQPDFVRLDAASGSSPFLMRIWGPAHHPSVRIAGNLHAVEVDVPEGARLEVDARDGTCVMTERDGRETNCLALRLVEDDGVPCDLFRPVPSGEASVEWDGSFWFELDLFDERSTPRWAS